MSGQQIYKMHNAKRPSNSTVLIRVFSFFSRIPLWSLVLIVRFLSPFWLLLLLFRCTHSTIYHHCMIFFNCGLSVYLTSIVRCGPQLILLSLILLAFKMHRFVALCLCILTAAVRGRAYIQEGSSNISNIFVINCNFMQHK